MHLIQERIHKNVFGVFVIFQFHDFCVNKFRVIVFVWKNSDFKRNKMYNRDETVLIEILQKKIVSQMK